MVVESGRTRKDNVSRQVSSRYTKRMKRTSLMLDERLLEEAVRLLGTKTYSEAVNKALQEAINVQKRRGLVQFYGSGLWEGDLSEMRGDRPITRRRATSGKRVRK